MGEQGQFCGYEYQQLGYQCCVEFELVELMIVCEDLCGFGQYEVQGDELLVLFCYYFGIRGIWVLQWLGFDEWVL